ncbi:RNA polymerase sigma factor [Robiginitalea sp. SC105]|uniref:RNA polymerase sigma factor n=1 Tax=Robiginitalea sp. SC105 TaxID=2762332 RepID=UPI001639FE40|nr:sigma-70 family RNA polymerase sigma factor [Robiginitalea sp. SC105]MBC2839378.1 sigma-70 family RNA polymerase sigma factor [Robiginitalea sp. SC105]
MEQDPLIDRFKKGDAVAFEQLHTNYSTAICGVVHSILRNRERAEELTQDVFVKIWNYRDQYDAGKGRFFTWILNIARNAAIDELRSKSHKEQQLNLHSSFFVDMAEEAEAQDFGVDINRVKELIRDLGKKCHQIIDLLYFKGLTQKETSEFLDVPLGTVKTRNRNCISRLRKNLPN